MIGPHMMTSSLGRHLFLAIALATCVGCGDSVVSDATALDAQIEDQWMANREVVDAIPFLEKGGRYENVGNKGEVPIDKPYVLPLLKRIRDELSLKPVAVLEGPQHAMAILIEIPKDPVKRQRMEGILQQAADSFPGLLMDNWGHKWLSLDYLDQQEVAALKSSGNLEPLQQELKSRRHNGN